MRGVLKMVKQVFLILTVSLFALHQSNRSRSTIFIDSFSCSGVSLEMKEFESSVKRRVWFCSFVECAISLV